MLKIELFIAGERREVSLLFETPAARHSIEKHTTGRLRGFVSASPGIITGSIAIIIYSFRFAVVCQLVIN